MIRGSTVIDIGSRTEKIQKDAVSIDLERRFRPDICASVESLPIRTSAFDYVTMLEVIEHLDSGRVDSALEECKRVCELLILSTPNCDSKVWNRIVWPLWSHSVGREWIGAHKQFFGKSSLEELLERKHGMKILERNYSKWNLLVRARTNPSTNTPS
jgi:2-polyprenyl-3-methyl-5-hydroxy-6-metoxy-1,4-benzoquinol methylase